MNETRVPYFDAETANRDVSKDIESVVKKVIKSGKFILGEEVSKFESEFADYCGVPYAVGVGSGVDALRLSLIACGVTAGDKVILPANTFSATAFAVSQIGAEPVFCDIDADTGLIDLSFAERLIRIGKGDATFRLKAVITVHLYGQIADVRKLKDICETFEISLIEDACQAHGALIDGMRSGSVGDVGCFSFYPTKNLGAFGDGGSVTTSSQDIAERISMLRNYGERQKGFHELIGWNSRLDEIQAGILREKLKFLDRWNEERRRIAGIYRKAFKDMDPDIILINENDKCSHVYHIFAIRVENRNEFMEWCGIKGVGTAVHYTTPVHLQPSYNYINLEGTFPNAERFCNEVVSLPLYPGLSNKQVNYVIEVVSNYFKTRRARLA